MALAEFIQSLQEQEVVYSQPFKSSTKTTTVEKQSMRILPPETGAELIEPHVSNNTINNETSNKSNKPVIKIKIKQKQTELDIQSVSNLHNTQTTQQSIQQNIQQNNNITNNPNSKVQQKSILKPVEFTYSSVNQSVNTAKTLEDSTTINNIIENNDVEIKKESSKKPISTELTDDEVFNNTGTEYSKKDLWLNYYNQAKNSRKKNPIVDRMKVGRFTITPDNKVLLLPDYDIVGKDPDDVLKDKWF